MNSSMDSVPDLGPIISERLARCLLTGPPFQMEAPAGQQLRVDRSRRRRRRRVGRWHYALFGARWAISARAWKLEACVNAARPEESQGAMEGLGEASLIVKRARRSTRAPRLLTLSGKSGIPVSVVRGRREGSCMTTSMPLVIGLPARAEANLLMPSISQAWTRTRRTRQKRNCCGGGYGTPRMGPTRSLKDGHRYGTLCIAWALLSGRQVLARCRTGTRRR
ncbi:hypothetical protein GY45DRAFT_323326 [Cubamyces sp. BRFM 1775]|nr:hypothetical protein GY45DRAFT_323326 [Cubamyces sp. BRFM 1775]